MPVPVPYSALLDVPEVAGAVQALFVPAIPEAVERVQALAALSVWPPLLVWPLVLLALVAPPLV